MARHPDYDQGIYFTEMNTIIRRINRRRIAEPTPKEKVRLTELKEIIRKLRKGES